MLNTPQERAADIGKRIFSDAVMMRRQAEANLSTSQLLPEIEGRLRQNPWANYLDERTKAQKYSEGFARRLIWC